MCETSFLGYGSQTDGVHERDKIHAKSNSRETLSEAIKRLKPIYTVKAIDEHNMDQVQAKHIIFLEATALRFEFPGDFIL